MATQIRLIDLSEGQLPFLLGQTLAELEKGLPALPDTPQQRGPSQRAGDPISAVQIIDMLRRIDPGSKRPEWLTVCGGLVNAPVAGRGWDGLDVFTRWSAGEFHGGNSPDNYEGPDDCTQQWQRDLDKLHNGEEIPAFGALVNLARKGGYTENVSFQSAANAFAPFLAQVAKNDAPSTNFRYVLRDPVADASRPPITYRDTVHLWPDSPGGTVTQIIAGPKKHKTNLILSEMFRLMLTNGARVLFVPLEGEYGVTTQRIPTLADHYGNELDKMRGNQSRLEYLRGRFQVASLPGFALDNTESVEAFIAAANEWAQEHGLGGWTDIVIDTQHRAAGGLEENSATDARTLWNAIERIRYGVSHDDRRLCNVTLLHHTGKDPTKRGRGSSADEAAVDQLLELKSEKQSQTASVTVLARKDGEDGIEVGFQIKPVGALRVPILLPIEQEEYRRLSRADDPYANAKIGAALHALGAFGSRNAKSSQALAAELHRQWDELPQSGAKQKAKARTVANNLTRRVKKGDYRGYLALDGGKPIKPYRWFLSESDE